MALWDRKSIQEIALDGPPSIMCNLASNFVKLEISDPTLHLVAGRWELSAQTLYGTPASCSKHRVTHTDKKGLKSHAADDKIKKIREIQTYVSKNVRNDEAGKKQIFMQFLHEKGRTPRTGGEQVPNNHPTGRRSEPVGGG